MRVWVRAAGLSNESANFSMFRRADLGQKQKFGQLMKITARKLLHIKKRQHFCFFELAVLFYVFTVMIELHIFSLYLGKINAAMKK